MKYRFLDKAISLPVAAVLVLAVATAVVRSQSADAKSQQPTSSSSGAFQSEKSVELSSSQLNAIKIEPVGTYLFPMVKETIGNINFADDLSVPVFPAFAGKIIQTLVELGDHVQPGQALYTIESPDLIQAESTLIGAAGVYELTNQELARVRGLNHTNGVSDKELEQATSDQQTADGALKGARNAVRVFGKSEAEIDQIIASRKVDPALVVRSPIAGEITSFNGPPGLFVQPGNGTAPFTVTDVSVKWMLANVNEGDIPLFRLGQPVTVTVMAYPNRVFRGSVSKIYATVDPATHRATIRSVISDPKNELRTGMLANFTIRVQAPVEAVAVPANGVVREGDGTMTAWVTKDRHRFEQRIVQVGLRVDGWVQVLQGVERGELVVTDGAVFLSNMLNTPPSD